MTKERQIRIMGVDILNSYIELERSRRCASNCPECLAEELYKVGYRKQEWISVDERLPEENEPVLVACKNAFGMHITPCVAELHHDGAWYAQNGDTMEWHSLTPTHWMPLPEAPRMKGGEQNG